MLQQVLSWVTEYAIKKKMKKLLKGLYIAGGNEFLYFPGKEYAAYSGFLDVYLEYNKDFDGSSIDSLEHLEYVLKSMVTNIAAFSSISHEVFTAWIALLSLLNFNKIHNMVAHDVGKAISPLKIESDPLRFLLKNKINEKYVDMRALKQNQNLMSQCIESIIQASKISLLCLKSHFDSNLKSSVTNLWMKLKNTVGSTAFEKIIEDHLSTDLDFRNPFLSTVLNSVENEVNEDGLIKLVDNLLLVDPSHEFGIHFKEKWEAWRNRQEPKLQNPCDCDLDVNVPRVVALNNYIMTNLVEVQMLEDILVSDHQGKHLVDNTSQDKSSGVLEPTEDVDIVCLSDMDEDTTEMHVPAEKNMFHMDFNTNVHMSANNTELEQDPLSPSLLDHTNSLTSDSEDIAKLFSQFRYRTVYPIPPITEIAPKKLSPSKVTPNMKQRTKNNLSRRGRRYTKNSSTSKIPRNLKRSCGYDFRECSVKLIRLDPSKLSVRVNGCGKGHNVSLPVEKFVVATDSDEESLTPKENTLNTEEEASIEIEDIDEDSSCVTQRKKCTKDVTCVPECLDSAKYETCPDNDVDESDGPASYKDTSPSAGGEERITDNTTDDMILADSGDTFINLVPRTKVPLKVCRVRLKRIPRLDM